MKFYYCSGFICLLMSMNVVSLFPTLPASMSQGASPDSRAALPFHASRPQLEEQAGLR